ncbi:tyrosine-type recombinase/integrase [Geminicoccus harenae]|uniref:tyrosine-type recombinase/integrase n=1 Tax=Geminicoccus harenae TaxID=2498453 RepID=UPI001C98C308|nr:site-specific integrase [Geminicoccus harenae]
MKLSAARAKNEARLGRHSDGAGLYLFVRSDGRKGWLMRYRLGGKQCDMGLGSYEVSLAAARRAAAEARERLRAGEDPISARRAERVALVRKVTEAEQRSFQALAERYMAKHEPAWKNPKHREQWRNSLINYVYPKIGSRDVAEIARADVLAILEAIWLRVPETAARVRGRIETILDYAASEGLRDAPNPARLKDLRHALPNAQKLRRSEHYPALPWQDLPAFMSTPRANASISARALEFTILTAKRTSEIIGATWQEINFESATWTIPPDRMKVPTAHRVPLSQPALSLLGKLLPERPNPKGFIFPGKRPYSQLSNMAMLQLVRGMQRPTSGKGQARWVDHLGREIVPHGFRSTFRDWVAEATNYPDAWAEAALAHTLKDKVVAAYQRSDLLEKRRELMEAWAEHARPESDLPSQSAGKNSE